MITLAALLLAAQPQPAKPRARPAAARPVAAKPDAEWLTGLWAEQTKPGVTNLEICATWDALFYRGDSSFTHGEREGYWQLQGSRIVETDQPAAELPPEDLAAAIKQARLVARLGPDRMRQSAPGGKSITFARCPKPETPVAP